jgi:ATP-binding cassette subfamily B protein/subfamily B ATP-binding cassette protein MsbA
MITALRLLLPHATRYRAGLVLALTAMGGEIVTAVLAPIPIQRAIDQVIRPATGRGHLRLHEIAALAGLALLVVVIALLDAGFTYLDLRHSTRTAQLATTDLRRALFAHIQRLSLAFHHDAETRLGDLQVRLGADVQALQDLVGSSLSSFVTNAGTAALMLALMFQVARPLGIVVLLGSLPVLLLAGRYRLRLKQASREARKREGMVSAIISESLGAARLVQAYGQEAEASDRMQRESEAGLQASLRAGELQARVQPLVELASALLTGLILVLSAVLAIQHVITVGQLTLAIAYTRGTLGAFRQLAKLSTQTQKASVGADRLRELFARAPVVRDPAQPRRLPVGPLPITFEHVTFGYTPGNAVLTDLSWTIPAGACAALIGPTGAGKTTLLSLVPRFYDVWSGRVLVGGIDVRELALADLRAHVTVVLQESLLLRDTIWNNIAYGRAGATRRQILAAAEAAGVTSFIDTLDDGWNTMVSERGTTLSGGQKQCIAIARALLRNTPIVIMDEPTSNMDQATEQLVVRGLERLTRGRTSITIAHRPSTIRHASLIATLAENVEQAEQVRGVVDHAGHPVHLDV